MGRKKSSKVRRGGKHHAGRKGTRKNNGFNNKAKFSTVTTYVGAINIPASTSAYRLDILPTLSVFPIDTTATRFQTYKPRRIRYKLLPRFNISSTPGTLPVIHTVPVQSHMIPAPTPLRLQHLQIVRYKHGLVHILAHLPPWCIKIAPSRHNWSGHQFCKQLWLTELCMGTAYLSRKPQQRH